MSPDGGRTVPTGGRVPHHRSLRVRLAVAFMAALVAMAASQAWVVSQQGPVRDSLRLVVEGYLPLSKQVARMVQDHERVQRDLERVEADRPRPGTGVLATYVPQLRDNVEIAGILARSLRARPAASGTEQAVLTRLLSYLDRVASLQERQQESLTAWSRAATSEEEASALRALRTATSQVGAELDRLARTLDDRIVDLTAEVEQRQSRATTGAALTFTLAGVLALLLLLASLVALRPIGQLTAEVQRMAAGARGARVEVRGRDEVGVLAEEFNAMAEAIAQRDQRLTERNAQLDMLSRHLASVVDTIQDALIVVEQGVVTRTNPAARARWGATDGRAPPEALAVALEPGTHDLSAADGTRHLSRAEAFGEDGVVVVVRDVTELVRAQDALARSERLALVGQMLAQITHEVRNPLNALSLNAELLADELTARDAGEGSEPWDILTMMRGEVARLTDVTGHYLQLARRPPARKTPTDVAEAVEEVARLLEPELGDQGASMDVEIAPLAPQLVDGNQLRQALINVVRNALEAGGRVLSLAVRPEGAEVVVALTDDGPGMTEAELARATDPFFSTKASGTGLGLAIVRQILEDHGGRVTLRSAPGEGTTVCLHWPRVDVARAGGPDTGGVEDDAEADPSPGAHT